jgi:vacuolar protein sorting-associated protein 1
MECSMSSAADAWTCAISLRLEYDSKGIALSPPITQKFGPVLSDKNQFEISLRRAQAAILNPHLSPDTFLRMTAQDLKNSTQSELSHKFSKNTVCVHISDPEATDLMFADLPGMSKILWLASCHALIFITQGLIQNESEDVIDLVRSLVESYIQKPETMILITIPMSGMLSRVGHGIYSLTCSAQTTWRISKLCDLLAMRILRESVLLVGSTI